MNLNERELFTTILSEHGMLDELYDTMGKARVSRYLELITPEYALQHGFVWDDTPSGHHSWSVMNDTWKGMLR